MRVFLHSSRSGILTAVAIGAVVAAGLAATPATAQDGLFDGPYVGLQAGHGSLRSELVGPRGPGTNRADMGDFGPTAGLFAGYGFSFDGAYLGVEADATLSDLSWSHFQPNGRSFGIESPHSWGLSVRAGGLIGESVLLYGRAGLVRRRLEADYRVTSGRTFDTDDTAHGVRLGGGVDIAASRSLFVRMDYSVAHYGDLGVQSSGRGTIDSFDSEESLFRVGFGWRIPVGDEVSAPPVPEAERFDGFYLGAGVRHDVIHSEQFGPRNVLPDTLTADRSGDGVGAGLFGGWGTTFGRAYVGAELEGGFSEAQWEQNRENPGGDAGRVVSVRPAWSVGAALRAGWVLADRALVYGRAGIVGTEFETDYGVRRTGDYDDDHSELGLKLGAGAEIALTEASFLQIDYSWTDYDSYSIDYIAPDGSPATDSFDNDVSSFRLGVGYRF